MTQQASQPSSRRTIRWSEPTLIASFVIAILLILAEAGIALLISDEELKILLSDVLYPVANLLATLALFWAARRSAKLSKELARAWYFFAFAQLAYFLGDLTWVVIEVILKQDPYPSISDGFYLLYYPLIILGILMLPKVRILQTERLKLIVNMATVVIAASLAYWVLLIGPMLRAGAAGDVLSLGISLAYPVLDMALLWILVGLLASKLKRQHWLPIFLLAGSAAIQALADSMYAYQEMNGLYTSGSWLDIIWFCSYALAGMAGIVHVLKLQAHQPMQADQLVDEEETTSPGRLSLIWNLTPILWMAISYLLLVWDHYQADSGDFGLLAVGTFVVGALVFLHQAISSRENSLLYYNLQHEFEEHKRTTAELRENEARSRALSDLTTDYVYSARVFPDGKMKLEWASDAFQSICGYTATELEGRGGWATIVHPEDVSVFAQRSQAFRQGKAEVNDYRIYNKEGNIRWLRDYGRGEVDAQGHLYRILGAAKDITDAKRTEQELAASQSRLRRFLNSIQSPILVTDREGRPYIVNDAARQLLAGAAIALDPPKRLAEFYRFYLAGSDELYPARRLPMFKAMWGETSKEDDIEIEKKGKRIRLTVQSIPIFDEANKKVEYIITSFE